MDPQLLQATSTGCCGWGQGRTVVFHPVTFQRPNVSLVSAVLELKLPNRDKINLDNPEGLILHQEIQ